MTDKSEVGAAVPRAPRPTQNAQGLTSGCPDGHGLMTYHPDDGTPGGEWWECPVCRLQCMMPDPPARAPREPLEPDPIQAVLARMLAFATTTPSSQQTRQKSAREMVEVFACELREAVAAATRTRIGRPELDPLSFAETQTAGLAEQAPECQPWTLDYAGEMGRFWLIRHLADELKALRRQVEDTILVAQTDADADGFITAYHFKTGAMHRLLARARSPLAPKLEAAALPRVPEPGHLLNALIVKWREQADKDHHTATDDDSGGIWAYQHEASGRATARREDADELEAVRAARAGAEAPRPTTNQETEP